MLYISYDDGRKMDARVRLGIYEYVLDYLSQSDKFQAFMVDLTEEQRKELREIDKFTVFADEYPDDTLEDLLTRSSKNSKRYSSSVVRGIAFIR